MLSQYIYSVCYPNMMVPYDVIFPIYYVVPKKICYPDMMVLYYIIIIIQCNPNIYNIILS